jgi:hypothetical protein
MAHLLVLEGRADRVHRRAGDPAAEELQPLGGGAGQEARLQERKELALVGQPVGEGGEARVGREVGEVERLGEAPPELLLGAEDDGG